ncbi:hypothetical protein BDW68DRAFT_162430 [Aspergillus falconensis]
MLPAGPHLASIFVLRFIIAFPGHGFWTQHPSCPAGLANALQWVFIGTWRRGLVRASRRQRLPWVSSRTHLCCQSFSIAYSPGPIGYNGHGLLSFTRTM